MTGSDHLHQAPLLSPRHHGTRPLRGSARGVTLSILVTLTLLAVQTVPLASALADDVDAARTRWRVAEDGPKMRSDLPVQCVTDENGVQLRVQCDEEAEGGPVCLVAVDRQTYEDAPLKRTRYCDNYQEPTFLTDLESVGFKVLPGIADAPPGWVRDEKGRVYQVTFDLLDRFYLGATWLPTLDTESPSDAPNLERMTLDMGFSASVYEPYDRSRHDFRAIEGNVALGGLELEGLLFGYDYSHDANRPFLRVVTFFGTPRRYDLVANIGWGMSLLDVESHLAWDTPVTTLEIGEIHAAWDLFQSSNDLYNIVRFELGSGMGVLWQEGVSSAVYVSPKAAFVGRFGLDRDGKHYLTADAAYVLHTFVSGPPTSTLHETASAELAYEWVMLALNDQPLSLRLGLGTEYFDALTGNRTFEDGRTITAHTERHWGTTATAGLRFSFWAPARVRAEELEAASYY